MVLFAIGTQVTPLSADDSQNEIDPLKPINVNTLLFETPHTVALEYNVPPMGCALIEKVDCAEYCGKQTPLCTSALYIVGAAKLL